MAGIVEEIIPRTKYDFVKLALNEPMEIVLVRAKDVSAFIEATILLRIHERNFPTGGSIDFIARAIAPSRDSPTQDFVYLPAAELAKIPVTTAAPTAVPGMLLKAVTVNFGSHLQFVLKATQVGSAPTDYNLTISADLVLKV